MALDIRRETIVGMGLLVLGLILLFRLFGYETFEDAGAQAKEESKEVKEEKKEEKKPEEEKETTATDPAAAQDNSVDGSAVTLAKQTVASTEGPVSPAEPSKVVTAPGVVRRETTSVRPSFPAAAGLEGVAEGGPFEKYVQMLVRSELAAEGKTAAVVADGFAMKEEGAIDNATGYVKKAWQGIFGAPVDLRLA